MDKRENVGYTGNKHFLLFLESVLEPFKSQTDYWSNIK